ncbi:MAG: DUF2079 domain-containing protein [Polyangiales bacterium]
MPITSPPSKFDEVVLKSLRMMTATLPLALIAGSLALGCFFLAIDLGPFFDKNVLPNATRLTMVRVCAGTMALPFVASALFAAYARHRKLEVDVSATLDRCSKRLAPLVLFSPVVFVLRSPSLTANPLVGLTLCLIIGVVAAVTFRECDETVPNAEKELFPSLAKNRVIPLVILGVSTVALAAFLIWLSLLRHKQFDTSAYDLAIFDNMMWQLVHGGGFASTPALGPEGTHLGRHITFGAFLLAPFYAAFPRAETLLVIQAVMVASTLIPIYSIGVQTLGSRWQALAIALSYAMYAPATCPVFYDFHFLTAAQPLIAWFLYFLRRDREKTFWLITVIALTWREDIGALLGMASMMMVLRGERVARNLIVTSVCLAYFVFAKFGLTHWLGGEHSQTFSWVYEGLWTENQRNMKGVVNTLISNPPYVLKSLLSERKLVYTLHLFVPLLFLPLVVSYGWVALLPAFGFTLLASSEPIFSIAFQYTAFWAPMLFFLLCVYFCDRSLNKPNNPLPSATPTVLAILLTGFCAGWNYSPVFLHKGIKGGFSHIGYQWTEADQAELEAFNELNALVPTNASVAATDCESPHLSARKNSFAARIGVFDAEYIVARTSELRGRSGSAQSIRKAIESDQYGFVGEFGPFMLWQRGADSTRNLEGKKRIGIHSRDSKYLSPTRRIPQNLDRSSSPTQRIEP